MKKRTKLLLYGFIIIVLVLILQQTSLPTSWDALTSSRSELQQNKSALLEQLHNQRSLLPITQYTQIVLDTLKGSDRLAVISKATIEAGIDLHLLNEEDLFIEEDSIAIAVPPAELLSIEVDPSGFTTIKQVGVWTNAELIHLQSKAKTAFEQNALRGNTIGKAEIRGRSILDGFLRSVGFKKITLL